MPIAHQSLSIEDVASMRPEHGMHQRTWSTFWFTNEFGVMWIPDAGPHASGGLFVIALNVHPTTTIPHPDAYQYLTYQQWVARYDELHATYPVLPDDKRVFMAMMVRTAVNRVFAVRGGVHADHREATERRYSDLTDVMTAMQWCINGTLPLT